MKQYLHIENDPDLLRILVASAVLHIFFIGLMSLSFPVKGREQRSYLVSLVPPVAVEKKTEGLSSNKPPVREVKIAPVRPEKIPQHNKPALKRAAPEKNGIVQNIDIGKNAPPPMLSRQSEPGIIPAPIRPEIIRQDQSPRSNLMETAVMRRNYRSSTVPENKERAQLQAITAPKRKPVKTDAPSSAPGKREAGFSAGDPAAQEPVLIAKSHIEEHTEIAPPERRIREDLSSFQDENQGQGSIIQGVREDPFPPEEEVREQGGVITRDMTTVRDELNEYVPAPGGYENTVADLTNSIADAASEQKEEPAIIEKPGVPGSPDGQGTEYSLTNASALNVPGIKGGPESTDKKPAGYTEISIQGIPLNDLMVCPNALEERTLKTRILEIVGNERKCYIPERGSYMFLGTGRFTSFDMIIVPEAGRELLNRCEELKSALFCLQSLRK